MHISEAEALVKDTLFSGTGFTVAKYLWSRIPLSDAGINQVNRFDLARELDLDPNEVLLSMTLQELSLKVMWKRNRPDVIIILKVPTK